MKCRDIREHFFCFLELFKKYLRKGKHCVEEENELDKVLWYFIWFVFITFKQQLL